MLALLNEYVYEYRRNNTYVILEKTAVLDILMLIIQVNRKPKNLLKLCGICKNGLSPNSTNQGAI